MAHKKLKQKALQLRKKGKTYSEILRIIPVAKSTLSEWLKKVGLGIAQQQRITIKRIQGRQKGAVARRIQRQKLQASIFTKSIAEIGSLSQRELWLIGVALYWAEGSKEKEYKTGVRTIFSNSDAQMIALYVQWLRECIKISEKSIVYDVYIHESHAHRVNECLKFWRRTSGLSAGQFGRVYFKRNKIHTKRKNTGALYNGLLRVTIASSSTLNRRITGWIQGIIKNCGIV